MLLEVYVLRHVYILRTFTIYDNQRSKEFIVILGFCLLIVKRSKEFQVNIPIDFLENLIIIQSIDFIINYTICKESYC